MAYRIFANDDNERILEFCSSESFKDIGEILKMVTCIQQETFRDSNLEEIVIPDNVSSIQSGAFGHCKKLKKVVLGNGLKEIPFACFDGCKALEEIVIPEGVESVSGHAFYGCSNLTNITFPTTLKQIEENAFGNCPKLTSVTLPRQTQFDGAFDSECNTQPITIKRVDYNKQSLIKEMIDDYADVIDGADLDENIELYEQAKTLLEENITNFTETTEVVNPNKQRIIERMIRDYEYQIKINENLPVDIKGYRENVKFLEDLRDGKIELGK